MDHFFATALAAQEQFLTGVICVYFFSADTVVIFSRATEPVQVFTDDLGRKVTVPAHPKRIVSLHDLDITIPLIELVYLLSPATGELGLTVAISFDLARY